MPPNALLPETPTPLHEPSLLLRWLFEEPLVPMIVAGVLALIVSQWLWRAGRLRAFAAALAAGLVVLAGLWLLASSVTTPRERVIQSTRLLARGTTAADGPAIDRLLADRCTLDNARGTLNLNKVAILLRVQATIGGPFRISDWAIVQLQAHADETRGQSQFLIRVTPEVTGVPNLSWWRVTWEKNEADDAAPWRATLIEPLSGTPAEVLR